MKHYRTATKFGPYQFYTACGVTAPTAKTTTDSEAVTCKRCGKRMGA